MSPCDGHGHYHPFQGQCVCGYGWVGRFCEVDAISACRNGSGLAQSCTTRREPLPCECIRQCLTAGSFAPHMREPWGEPVCSWRGEYVSWKLDGPGKVQLASVAAEHPLRGASKRDHLWWDEQFEAWTCYNGCSGRGACLHGSCVCSVGFYGPGCAHPVDGAVEATVPSSQLQLYVYDLPALITGRRSYPSDWDKERIFSTAQRAFIPTLLRDAASLTQDPSKADLFVVPAAATNMEALGEYYHHLLRHVRQRWPFWNASRGANHVWLCSADRGGGVLASMPGVSNGLALAHYFKGRMRASHLVYAPLLHGAVAVARHAYSGFGQRGWHAAEEARRGETLLFFAGNFRLNDKTRERNARYGCCEYSEGVRQALYELRNTSGFRLVERSETYAEDYRHAHFCAAPLGEGWGTRLVLG